MGLIISYTWSGGITTVYQRGSVSYTVSFIIPPGYTNSGSSNWLCCRSNGTTPTTSTSSTTTTTTTKATVLGTIRMQVNFSTDDPTTQTQKLTNLTTGV